jgi:hypothetical protein
VKELDVRIPSLSFLPLLVGIKSTRHRRHFILYIFYVWCKILLVDILVTETFLWLSDPKWIVQMFLLIHLGVSGAAVKQSETRKMFVLEMRSWHNGLFFFGV